MKNIQSFIREHPLCKNALWLLLFVPLFFLSQFPLITMVYSLQEGVDARWVTILTLLVTVAVLFVFYKVIKMSPLENLDVRVITWPALGRNFLFLLLLMANNLLAYPLLKQEAGGTTANQAALNELQSHAPFFTYLHGPSTLGEWVAYGGMSLILTWVAYRYKRIEYSICLHMTLNALAYYYPAVLLLCLLPVSRVFFHDKL